MTLLDYIFYRATRFYEINRRKREPEIPGFGLTCLIAAGFLVDLAIPVCLYVGPESWHYADYYAVGVSIATFIFCLFRYTRTHYLELKAKWYTEEPDIARKRALYLKAGGFVVIVLPTLVRIFR